MMRLAGGASGMKMKAESRDRLDVDVDGDADVDDQMESTIAGKESKKNDARLSQLNYSHNPYMRVHV
jgi:hypothetical protein